MERVTLLRTTRLASGNLKFSFLVVFVLTSLPSFAQEPAISDSTQNTNTNFHFQLTTVTQHKFYMPAPYTGTNSLIKSAETETTLTATIFWGTKLWKNASIYVNPEIAGGSGISGAHGIAGFTNGEAFRVGDPEPQLYLARAFFRQTIAFSNDEDYVGEGANHVYKTRAKKYLTFIVGKISLADFFDNNRYSHDPRSNFFNWGLMSNGAWDYAANVRGYTWAVVVEYGNPAFKIRASTAMVPTEANGNTMDSNITQANSSVVEVELPFRISGRPGIFRSLAYFTNAHMGNYDLAVQQNPDQPDITATRAYGRTKFGIGINVEQSLNDNAGLFARASWNDGRNETWVFTEIDRSVSLGYLTSGNSWKRSMDQLGVATVVSGLSDHHRRYLESGGLGFIIGDGALRYGYEWVTEIFYKINLFYPGFFITPNYQFIMNPAYNKDRGPANTFGIRAHVEF